MSAHCDQSSLSRIFFKKILLALEREEGGVGKKLGCFSCFPKSGFYSLPRILFSNMKLSLRPHLKQCHFGVKDPHILENVSIVFAFLKFEKLCRQIYFHLKKNQEKNFENNISRRFYPSNSLSDDLINFLKCLLLSGTWVKTNF